MRPTISFILIVLIFFAACSSNQTKHRKRYFKYPPKELSKTKRTTPPVKINRKKINQKKINRKIIKKAVIPAMDSNQKILLPTQIHAVDGTLMVLVDLPNHGKHRTDLMQKRSNLLNKRSTISKELKAFYIDHTEVTLRHYKKIHPKYNESNLIEKQPCLSCPVMGVSWVNADKHCRLLGKRLPTEEEWELAGQGSAKRTLSLSNKANKPRANLIGEDDGFLAAAPVASFPLGAGFYGPVDMIGNVWEWVSTPHSPISENLNNIKNKSLRVSKGGSWASPSHVANTSYRNIVDGDTKNPTFGFRCVKSIN